MSIEVESDVMWGGEKLQFRTLDEGSAWITLEPDAFQSVTLPNGNRSLILGQPPGDVGIFRIQ